MKRNLWILGLAVLLALVAYDGGRRNDDENENDVPAAKPSFAKKVAKIVARLNRRFERRAKSNLRLINIDSKAKNATKGDF